MPARLAIAPVLVAWNPFAANSLTAAAMTCSRRSSDVDLTAMPDRLLIDLSIVKAGQRRERCRGWRAEGGARSGPGTVARAAGRGRWRAAGRGRWRAQRAADGGARSGPRTVARAAGRGRWRAQRAADGGARSGPRRLARTCTKVPTGAGATRSSSSRPVTANLPRSNSSSAIASSRAAAITPPCAYPGGPWWSCFTKNRPSTPPSAEGSSSSCSPNRFAGPQPKQRPWWTILGSAEGTQSAAQPAQNEVEDPSVTVVAPLVRRVDPHPRLELHPVRRAHLQSSRPLLERREVERLLGGQPERLHRLALRELQWQHAHPDQIGPVDSLVGLGDHEPHPQQARPLGGPVPRRPGAVFLARQH